MFPARLSIPPFCPAYDGRPISSIFIWRNKGNIFISHLCFTPPVYVLLTITGRLFPRGGLTAVPCGLRCKF